MTRSFDTVARALADDTLTRRETLVRLVGAFAVASPLAGLFARAAAAQGVSRANVCDDCFTAVRSKFDKFQKRRLLLQENDALELMRMVIGLSRATAEAGLNAIACAESDRCIDPCWGCTSICGTCPCVTGGMICCLYEDVDGRSPCCPPAPC